MNSEITPKQAIKILKSYRYYEYCDKNEENEQAFDLAISALSADGDLISRFRDYQIEWLTSHNDLDLHETEMWVVKFIKDSADGFIREELPTIPQTYEWCKGCKEYDTENHCCHRYSSFIRESLQDNVNYVLEEIKAEINAMYDSNEYTDEFEHGIMAVKELINKHISGKE